MDNLIEKVRDSLEIIMRHAFERGRKTSGDWGDYIPPKQYKDLLAALEAKHTDAFAGAADWTPLTDAQNAKVMDAMDLYGTYDESQSRMCFGPANMAAFAIHLRDAFTKPTDAPAQFMDQADEALWLSGNG